MNKKQTHRSLHNKTQDPTTNFEQGFPHEPQSPEQGLLALQARLKRQAKADCDPANGSAIAQARGRLTQEFVDALTPHIAAQQALTAERDRLRAALWAVLDYHYPKCEGRAGLMPTTRKIYDNALTALGTTHKKRYGGAGDAT